ncbi:hypothetical protein Bbelb_099320 [Branchiostoma belcheri]|nr:hypothetical protein Bbelb_099320 [Branchiostoma belcheri]
MGLLVDDLESSGLQSYTLEQLKADFKADCPSGVFHCLIRLRGLHADRDDFRVDCELCRHWGLSRRTGAKQNCAGGVEERRGRSRFFAGAKQNGAGAKQNGGGEEEGVSWGCEMSSLFNF